jgi:hypothetical protein
MICSNGVFTYFVANVMVEQILPVAARDRMTVGIAGFTASLLSISLQFLGGLVYDLLFAVGGVSFSVIGFVLPPVYYFAQYHGQSVRWSIVAGTVLLMGGGMMIISLVIAIQDVVAA